MSRPGGSDSGGPSREAERHSRLSSVLADALERPEGERGDFVTEACADDSDLAAEILALLALEARPAARVAVPANLQDARLLSHEPKSGECALEAGSGIAGFHVLRVIGQGGMGTVYEAEQERPQRRVALKVIRALHATDAALTRFRREADVLARLQHPGICQVLEVGQDASGAPYIGMELIEGRNILEHARDRGLGRSERVALLGEVCDAVGHAHERGIVHRDLKPENILVTAEGRPKIVDFGIARMTGPDSGGTLLTSTGALMGTLSYMSPEQASGEAEIDARADVYALGMLAFELLTERSPVTLEGLSLPQALHVMQRAEHSLALRAEAGLRGDLDTILGKALEREPERRYASAHDLASDLRRFLQHQPIVARPPGLGYRLGKFTRRHRLLVAATTLVVASLCTGAILALEQARVARQRAEVAERQGYRASLGAAVAALDSGLAQRASEQLRGAPQERRAWEYDHLQAVTAEQFGEAFHDGRASDMQFSADGSRLFALETAAAGARLLEFEVPGFALVATRPLDARPLAVPGESMGLALTGVLLAGSRGESLDVVDAQDGTLLARVKTCEGLGDLSQLHVSASSLLAAGRSSARPPRAEFDFTCDLHDGRALPLPMTPGLVAGLSTDGGRVVIASGRKAELIDARTGDLERTLPGSIDGLSSAAFSPDGRFLYTAGLAIDPVLRKWEIATGRPVAERPISRAGVGECWAFAADGGVLAVTGNRAVIHVFDSDLSTELFSGSGSASNERGQLAGLALDPAGRHLVASGTDDTLRHWDLRGPRAEARLRGHESYVYAVDFSPDGRFLASASWDGSVRVWDVATQELAQLVGEACGGACYDVAWSFDNSRLYAAGRGGLFAIDAATGERRESLPRAQGLPVVQTNPARPLLGWLTGERLRILDGGTLAARADWTGVRSFGWSPDGETLAVLATDGTLTLRDDSTLESLWSVDRSEWTNGNYLNFSGDGERLWFVSDAGLSECNTHDGEERRRLPEFPRPFSAARTLDDRGFVTGTADGTLVFWDLESGDSVLALDAHPSYVKDLAFSRNGLHLASASGDGTVGLRTIDLPRRTGPASPRAER